MDLNLKCDIIIERLAVLEAVQCNHLTAIEAKISELLALSRANYHQKPSDTSLSFARLNWWHIDVEKTDQARKRHKTAFETPDIKCAEFDRREAEVFASSQSEQEYIMNLGDVRHRIKTLLLHLGNAPSFLEKATETEFIAPENTDPVPSADVVKPDQPQALEPEAVEPELPLHESEANVRSPAIDLLDRRIDEIVAFVKELEEKKKKRRPKKIHTGSKTFCS